MRASKERIKRKSVPSLARMTCMWASRFRRKVSYRRKQSRRAGSNLDEDEEEEEEDRRREFVRCAKLAVAVQ